MQKPAVLFFVAMLVTGLPSLAMAETSVERSYRVVGAGQLVLRMPNSWEQASVQPSPDLPPVIIIEDRELEEFSIGITPHTRGTWHDSGYGTPEMVQSAAERTASHIAQSADASPVDVLPLGGDHDGFYYSARIGAPGGHPLPSDQPGFITGGYVMVGDLFCYFFVLTHEGDSPVIGAALEMMRDAVHRRGD